MTIAPTQSNILKAVKDWLGVVLPGVEVITAQPNRVAEPKTTTFVMMSPPNFERLATNIDSADDVKFTASIAGTVMTVTAVDFGTIAVGATVFGVGVAANTQISSLGTGTGGTGTYNLTVANTVASGTLSSGAQTITQKAQAMVQLDFHSKDGSAGDLAQTVATLWRDAYGVDLFATQNPSYGVSPLYADDPRQQPFTNDQQQVEWRWVLQAMLQADQMVSVPQQYADSVSVEVVSVEASFPPS